jgi:hypothetical protein
VICVSEQLIRDEPDQLKQLFEVLNQQCKELSNDLEAVNLISERYKLNVTETEIWFSMTHWSEDFEMPERALTVAIEYINRLGIAQKPTATAGDVWHSLGVN